MPKAEAKAETEHEEAPAPEASMTSTKAKLAAVIGTFQEFDTTMRIGTRVRRTHVFRRRPNRLQPPASSRDSRDSQHPQRCRLLISNSRSSAVRSSARRAVAIRAKPVRYAARERERERGQQQQRQQPRALALHAPAPQRSRQPRAPRCSSAGRSSGIGARSTDAPREGRRPLQRRAAACPLLPYAV